MEIKPYSYSTSKEINFMKKYNIKAIFLIVIINSSFITGINSQSLNQSDNRLQTAIIELGKQLMGKTYEAGTLESEGPEKLTYRSDAFDCVTFVEYVLAKSMSQIYPERGDFEKQLQDMRYRNGRIDGYGSRIHYFTEWIYENGQNYRCKSISKSIGGKLYQKTINFISTNKAKYPKLKDSVAYAMILKSEHLINQQKWFFIPKGTIKKIQHLIQDGDVIAITTSIKGLDVVHTGFAVWQKGKLHLLHASELEKKVVISQKPISEYLKSNKNQSGIMVVRWE